MSCIVRPRPTGLALRLVSAVYGLAVLPSASLAGIVATGDVSDDTTNGLIVGNTGVGSVVATDVFRSYGGVGIVVGKEAGSNGSLTIGSGADYKSGFAPGLPPVVVGGLGTALVEVQAGGALGGWTNLSIGSLGTLRISGGNLSVLDASRAAGGVLDFQSGVVFIGSAETVGSAGFFAADPNLTAGKEMTLGGLTIDAGHTATLAGGKLAISSGGFDGPGTFAFNGGQLWLRGADRALSTTGLLGASIQLTTGKTLLIDDRTTIAAGVGVVVDGGALALEEVVELGTLTYEAGDLELTQRFVIGEGGLVGNTLTLGAGDTIRSLDLRVVGGDLTIDGGTIKPTRLGSSVGETYIGADSLGNAGSATFTGSAFDATRSRLVVGGTLGTGSVIVRDGAKLKLDSGAGSLAIGSFFTGNPNGQGTLHIEAASVDAREVRIGSVGELILSDGGTLKATEIDFRDQTGTTSKSKLSLELSEVMFEASYEAISIGTTGTVVKLTEVVLDVSLLPGELLGLDRVVTLADWSDLATFSGLFQDAAGNPLGEGALIGSFNGIDLFITYQGRYGTSDTSGISLYTVPEPSAIAAVGLGGTLLLARRRR